VWGGGKNAPASFVEDSNYPEARALDFSLLATGVNVNEGEGRSLARARIDSHDALVVRSADLQFGDRAGVFFALKLFRFFGVLGIVVYVNATLLCE
jgi:hypothetical protein